MIAICLQKIASLPLRDNYDERDLAGEIPRTALTITVTKRKWTRAMLKLELRWMLFLSSSRISSD